MAILENQGTRLETAAPPQYEVRAGREPEKTAEIVAGGAGIEALCGAGAVVLAILGLSRIMPEFMAGISLIVLGAGMLFFSAAIASRARHLMYTAGTGDLQKSELGGGLGVEFLGGCAGIVLGILGLLKIHPLTLEAVGVIAVGGALLLGAAAMARMRTMMIYQSSAHPTAQMIARESVVAASGLQALAGAGGVVLGILALVGYYPLTLTLVGLLSLGGALLLAGGALSGALFGAARR